MDILLSRTPAAPKHLNKIARDHFLQTFRALIKMGIATELDRPMIEMASQQWELYRLAEKESERQAAIASYMRIMAKYGGTAKDRKIMKMTGSKKSQPEKSERYDDGDIEEEFDL